MGEVGGGGYGGHAGSFVMGRGAQPRGPLPSGGFPRCPCLAGPVFCCSDRSLSHSFLPSTGSGARLTWLSVYTSAPTLVLVQGRGASACQSVISYVSPHLLTEGDNGVSRLGGCSAPTVEHPRSPSHWSCYHLSLFPP